MSRRVRALVLLVLVVVCVAGFMTGARDAIAAPVAARGLVQSDGTSTGPPVNPLQGDTTPPVTLATLTGTTGLNGWYVSSVLVILTANDSASNVSSTFYRVDNGTWVTYGAPFTIAVDGRHSMDFFSIDTEGNLELPKSAPARIDRNQPVFLSLSPSGVVHTSDVLLQWEAEDNVSGIFRYEISVDGEPFASIGTASEQRVTVADGQHSVQIRATDLAGNSALAGYDFRVDTSVLSLTGPQGILLLALLFGLNLAVVLAIYARARRKQT